MVHPNEGVLRRLLDEPVAVAQADREHVARCEECRRRVTMVREDAALVSAALATEAADVRTDVRTDVGSAWQRLSAASAATGRVRTAPPRPGRVRALLRRPVVASVAALMVVTGAGAAAANDWFQVFRTERVAPVSLDTADLNALPDLREYGEVALTSDPDVHRVADARAATAETGLDVPHVPSLPRGVNGEPAHQVGGEASVTFTFSAERAARAAARAGRSLPPPPPGLDGSQVRLVAGPGVAAVWTKSGVPVLVVGRAVAPRGFSNSGASFETMRDYVLSLPRLPESVAAPLRTFNASGSTLPLPVPADRFTTSSAQVDGQVATVLTSRDRTMAAVIWVDDGVVNVVAGALDAGEVVAVAGNLR